MQHSRHYIAGKVGEEETEKHGKAKVMRNCRYSPRWIPMGEDNLGSRYSQRTSKTAGAFLIHTLKTRITRLRAF